jgi:hypothetical protein
MQISKYTISPKHTLPARRLSVCLMPEFVNYIPKCANNFARKTNLEVANYVIMQLVYLLFFNYFLFAAKLQVTLGASLCAVLLCDIKAAFFVCLSQRTWHNSRRRRLLVSRSECVCVCNKSVA